MPLIIPGVTKELAFLHLKPTVLWVCACPSLPSSLLPLAGPRPALTPAAARPPAAPAFDAAVLMEGLAGKKNEFGQLATDAGLSATSLDADGDKAASDGQAQ